ncbi:hypothetical protein QMK17_01950 [Rhodococcus sp. G-MC3]|uniref:hypothetical protein n=1 Tax=Rhodococcus sp. G-MC3 TaxID=3046209 RepID=UPI0024BAF2FB|nr:hypothetical protein [Rhodococcus sp. G-MC3]MDJ0392094.1 hypothetical protein [Rhodococcus sp. G-MC3]
MSEDEVLFHEPGARWFALTWGPIFCAIALVIELFTGPVIHWFALSLFAVLLVGFTYVQISAARRHVSVELTGHQLRQGTESVDLSEIAAVLPAAAYSDGDFEPKQWETARVLGELSGVPRRRHGIGLRLVGGTLVQAWAKDDDELRDALEKAVTAKS